MSSKSNPGSEDQDTALFKSLEQFVLDNYPNPRRVGCLPRAQLEALLDHPGSLNLDVKYSHIMECAECTRDLIDLRAVRSSQNAMKHAPNYRSVVFALCAGILIALFGGIWIGAYFRPQPAPRQLASAEQLVDLASIPSLRGNQPDTSIAMLKDAGIFIFELPPYTPAGKFHISLLNKEQDEIMSTDAESRGDKGHLKLPVSLDISHLAPGEYRLALRSEHDTAPYFYNIRIQ